MAATSAPRAGATSRRRRRAPLEPPTETYGRGGTDRSIRTLVAAVGEGLRITTRLLADARVPLGDKAAALAAVAYLVSPIDVISDVLPVVGQLDDLALVLWAWRRLVQGAGADVVADRWDGDRGALDMVLRFAGLAR